VSDETRNPLDTALDLLLYAPVGLAITAAEELPRLAAKGRSRVESQISIARVVGQFAVSRGRQEFERRFQQPTPATGGPSAEPADYDEAWAYADDGTDGSFGGSTRPAEVSPDEPGESHGALVPPPEPGSLAIPGYDSLSASQVVQRLAGLTPEELDAVGAYERAHRGRRTILNRIDQLQGR
jgi:hypothetical protein